MASMWKIQMFALDTANVQRLMFAPVTKDGCKSIARSLIALVSHPICLIEFVQVGERVSNLMNVIAAQGTKDTSVKELKIMSTELRYSWNSCLS